VKKHVVCAMSVILAAMVCISALTTHNIHKSRDLTLAVGELKDPDSVSFRNVHSNSGGTCGELNAKNSFGAYTGYQKFIVVKNHVVIYDTIDDRTWATICK